MPIGLARIGHRVHHKGVDIGDREPVLREVFANGLFSFVEQAGRPGVRHVGQDLNTAIAEAGDLCDRILDREMHVGIAAEG